MQAGLERSRWPHLQESGSCIGPTRSSSVSTSENLGRAECQSDSATLRRSSRLQEERYQLQEDVHRYWLFLCRYTKSSLHAKLGEKLCTRSEERRVGKEC